MSANGCQKRDVAVVGVAAMRGTVPPPRWRERPKSRGGRFRSGEPGAQRAATSSTAARESLVTASQRQKPWIAPA